MYKVTLVQKLQYTETITGFFTSIVEAQAFAKSAIQNFEKCSVTISYHEELNSEEGEDK